MAQTDLEVRLLEFSKSTITLLRSLQPDTVSRPVIGQLVRSATSIGANYKEAQNGISRNDFRAKVYISKKEAQETLYWLDLLPACFPAATQEISLLRNEAAEIVRILQAITTKLSPQPKPKHQPLPT